MVSGMVDALYVIEGERVTQGQALARISGGTAQEQAVLALMTHLDDDGRSALMQTLAEGSVLRAPVSGIVQRVATAAYAPVHPHDDCSGRAGNRLPVRSGGCGRCARWAAGGHQHKWQALRLRDGREHQADDCGKLFRLSPDFDAAGRADPQPRHRGGSADYRRISRASHNAAAQCHHARRNGLVDC